MKVRDLMTYPIVVVRPNTTVFDTIGILVRESKGSVLVTKEGLLKEVKGIVTTTRIFTEVLSKGLDPKKVTVSEIMTPAPLVTISPNATTMDAAILMRERGVRRLPVVEEGALVGIITSKDLLKCVK
jgi:CBS domain-containing protein